MFIVLYFADITQEDRLQLILWGILFGFKENVLKNDAYYTYVK